MTENNKGTPNFEQEQLAKDLAKKSVGEIIREHRMKKGMTQDALAAALYVTPQAISRWETGQTAPDINLLVPLSNLLELSVDQLLGGNRRDDFEHRLQESIRMGGNDPKRQILVCEEALKAFPNDETFLYRRACDEYFIGIDPHTPPQYAKAYRNRAVFRFRYLHEKHPEDQTYRSFLAKAYAKTDNYERANELLAGLKDKKEVEALLIKHVLQGEERLQKLQERTHRQTLDLLFTLLKYDTPDATRQAHGLLDAITSADMDDFWRIRLYLNEAGFAAEAGDMEAYEQKMRLAYQTAVARDCEVASACDTDQLRDRLVANANSHSWWSEIDWLAIDNLLGNILISPRLAPPCATKQLLVEQFMECRPLLRAQGRRYFEFCSDHICAADDPYRYSIDYDLSEQASDAMHAQIDESCKQYHAGAYAHIMEIYRNTVEQLVNSKAKGGVVAYTPTSPCSMLYGYCNCGAKQAYEGLPIDWRKLPTPDGARVFAIMDMLIPTNFEDCGLEKKLLTYALEQAREQNFTHAEYFLYELGMRGAEPHERTPRFERLLSTCCDLGFDICADLSHEHGRLYILRKEL